MNAIGTAVLRADLLPEPQRGEVRALFRQYVAIRVNASRDDVDISKVIAESEAIQDQIWSRAVALARSDLDSDIGALFVVSLNEVFDLQTSRVTVGLQYRIPASIWLVLLVIVVFSMAAVGYQFGLAGHDSRLIHIALAIAFSAVVWLIADLDRANEGALRVSQQPMLQLHQKLNAAK